MPPPQPQPPTPLDIPTFARAQLTLLASELAAEAAETSALVQLHAPAALQRAGVALINLVVGAQRTGLGGKTVLELVPDASTTSSTEELPEHGIRTGDLVVVAEQPAGSAKKREVKELERRGVKGVVVRVGRGVVGVAVEGEEDGGGGEGLGGRVWMVKVADEVTYKR